MILKRISVVLFLFATSTLGFAESLPKVQSDLFLSFARDVSGGDPDIMAQTQALIDKPPTTVKTIGFYGLEDAPAPERTLRGIISILDDRAFLLGVEDKYVYELPFVLEQLGWADGAQDPNLDVLGRLVDIFGADQTLGDDDWQAFRAHFVVHVSAVEASVRRAGRELLSLQLPLGDTIYMWAPSPDVAETWRNRPLYLGLNTLQLSTDKLVIMAVTEPAWQDYWAFMTYAVGVPEPYRSMSEGLD